MASCRLMQLLLSLFGRALEEAASDCASTLAGGTAVMISVVSLDISCGWRPDIL